MTGMWYGEVNWGKEKAWCPAERMETSSWRQEREKQRESRAWGLHKKSPPPKPMTEELGGTISSF